MLVFYNGDGRSTLMEFVHESFRCKQFILKLVVSSSGRFLWCNRDGIGRGRCMFLDGFWKMANPWIGEACKHGDFMVKQNHHTIGQINVATGNILLPATLTTGIGLAEGGLVEKKSSTTSASYSHWGTQQSFVNHSCAIPTKCNMSLKKLLY